MFQRSYWQIGCLDGRTNRPINPKHRYNPGYINGYEWGVSRRLNNQKIVFDIAGHKVGIEELIDDVNAAKKQYGYNAMCFSWATVEALLDKIKELEKRCRY